VVFPLDEQVVLQDLNSARLHQQFASTRTYLYTCLKRGAVRVKCLTQHNDSGQESNLDVRSGVESTKRRSEQIKK